MPELGSQRRERGGIRGLVDDVAKLPGAAAEVVELLPVVNVVLDVQEVRRVNGDVRRWSAVGELVLAEVLDQVVAPPGDRIAMQERNEAVAVLRRARRDPGELAD